MKTKLLALACLMSVGQSFAATQGAQPLDIIKNLYTEFSHETYTTDLLPILKVSFAASPSKVLAQYLTSDLNAMVVADKECSVVAQDTCGLDFFPLWGAIDPEGATVELSKGPSPDKVKALSHFRSETRTMVYRLEATSAGWRIADIEYVAEKLYLVNILGTSPYGGGGV